MRIISILTGAILTYVSAIGQPFAANFITGALNLGEEACIYETYIMRI